MKLYFKSIFKKIQIFIRKFPSFYIAAGVREREKSENALYQLGNYICVNS